MKKFALMFAAFGLTLPAQLVIATPAQAGFNTIDDFCRAYVPAADDPETNVGECISLLTFQIHFYREGKNSNAYSQHACDYIEETQPTVFYSTWSSKQDCMDRFLNG